MRGSVGWYRKDFELPDKRAALEWAVRFESVNYRTRVYLNGREIGRNAGAYIPFTMRLKGLRKRGVNRLVVRVDSRRLPTDFPPSGLSTTGNADRRLVQLRRHPARGLPAEARHGAVQHRPGAAQARRARAARPTVDFTLALENVTSAGRRISAVAKFGSKRIGLGTRRVRGGKAEVFERPAAARAGPAVVAQEPVPVPRQDHRLLGRADRRHLRPQERRALDQGLARAALPQRPARELPRRRRARGHPRAGLRGRQRVPRPARRRGAGGRRDGAAHALPDAPATSTSSPTGSGC